MEIVIKTFAGLEELLASEVRQQLGKEPVVLRRAVSFEGELADVYKANYLLRTALRVLVLVGKFPAQDEERLYRGIKKIHWEDYFSVQQTFVVDSFVHSQKMNHSLYISLKTKDAIADRFREKFGKRPSVDKEFPDIRIHVHIADDQGAVYFDSSGSSLHQRGYKHSYHPANLSEVMAAGLVMLSGWNARTSFLDPFCGSGTIAAEAAMIAHKIPAGFFRKKFGFESWRDFDEQLWSDIRLEYRPSYNMDLMIFASDKEERWIVKNREWCARTPLKNYINWSVSDFKKLEKQTEDTFIICNPPYGDRLKEEDLDQLYADLGRWLKFESGVRNAWIFSGNPESLKRVGLKPSQKFNLLNGPIECRFVGYSLYAGTRY